MKQIISTSKVHQQLQEIINRGCAAYCCQDDLPLILLNCGHTLHKECLERLVKIECPVCNDDLSYLRPTLPKPVYQPSAPPYQAPKPVFQHAPYTGSWPKPSYHPHPKIESRPLTEKERTALLYGTIGVFGVALIMWAYSALAETN